MNRKITLFLACWFSLMTGLEAQKMIQVKNKFALSQSARGYLEGFNNPVDGDAFFYGSIRDDVHNSYIIRSNDGSMKMEWQTQAVPSDKKKGPATFLWIASMDRQHAEVGFEVWVNGQKKFVIKDNKSLKWSETSEDGGVLSYSVFKIDEYHDGHGYMWLTAPEKWLTPGKPLTIKIVGQPLQNLAWFMTFHAKDAVEYMVDASRYEGWFEMSAEKKNGSHQIQVTCPAFWEGKSFAWESGKNKGALTLKASKKDPNVLTGTIKVPASDKLPLTIRQKDQMMVHLDNLLEKGEKASIRGKALVLVHKDVKEPGRNVASVKVMYKPKLSQSLLSVSNSPLSKGKIYLVNSSHQDIAWMDSPEKCIIERDTMLLTPLFEQAPTSPYYRFDIEDVLMIKEYLERHPDRKAEMQKLLKEGKVTCGSTFQMPYEEMYSGEALVRQFYLGARWLKENFDGYEADTYWNVDVPGRTLQMPQIAAKSGTKNMIISRHEKGVFNWYSPDGSYVTTYSPGHYSTDYGYLNRDFYDAVDYLAESVLEWQGDVNNKKEGKPAIPIMSDKDMSPAHDYSLLVHKWNAITHIEDEKGNPVPVNLPEIEVTTTPEFMKAIVAASDKMPSIEGERPAVWLYIHGPSHQKALKASREGDIAITQAEKFATINALVEGSFRNYPEERLQKAWEAKIYPDHGWGGNKGEITDALFLRTFEWSRDQAVAIRDEAVQGISRHVKTKRKQGTPVVVYNSLSWERNDPVSFEVTFDQGQAMDVRMQDAPKGEVPCQLTEEVRYDDGSLKKAQVHMVASKVPAMGYKTFYVVPLLKGRMPVKSKFKEVEETSFYTVTFGKGGLKQIHDKALNVDLLETSEFLGGDIFTMHSFGNGAGEFSDVQQPTMEGFDKTSAHEAKWEKVASGPVFDAWKYRQPIRHAVVENTIRLYHQVKQIDFEVALLNWEGVLYREFRMALPLAMDKGQVSYEVPFGVVEVGKDEMKGAAGERYTAICSEIHPRAIENWIGASNDQFGVTLSSSVVAADYLDPTNKTNGQTLLQPILLASRKSCHWKGNDYLQTGNHHFSFSLTSHKPGWENGASFGRQANEKLVVVVNPQSVKGANLPEEKSFFSTDKENVVITALKKGEDANDVVIRFYETGVKETPVMIQSFKGVKQAEKTDMLEYNGKVIPSSKEGVPMTIGKHAIETIKLKL